jgi:hypothetical protein
MAEHSELEVKVEEDLGTVRLDEWRVTDELKHVARSLLGANDDRFAAQILPLPRRLAIARALTGKGLVEPPKLVLIPALRQPTCREQRQRVMSVSACGCIPRKKSFVILNRLFGATFETQRDCAVELLFVPFG